MNRVSLFRSTLAWVLLLCMLVGLMPVNVLATEDEEEAEAATKAATSYVAQIDALATPYNVAISPTTNKYTEVFANNGLGYYYVVNKESSTVGHLLSMSEQNVDQYIPSTDVTISGNTLTDPNPNNAIYIKATADYRGLFYPYKGNTLTLTRESGNDAYLLTVRGLLADNKMGGRVSNGLWVFPIFGTGAVGDDNDAWFTLTYDATEDAFAFAYHGKDHLSFLSTQTMQLYRVYTQGIELYKAMKAVRGYADGNTDGRYPDDLYVTFSNYLKSCIDAYTANNTATEDEAGLKTTLDDMADQLFAYANDLSANVTDLESYIDIPIEILDFRADGMLIEWDRATNPLWNFRGQSGQTGASQHFVKFPPGENQTVYTGLTESKLIDGQMIYTEKVVGYVAGLLSKKYATDWSTNTKIPGYNNISYEKMSDLIEMGTFAETIGKTDTEKNGGYLHWSEVTSYYDMAYYILNNLWRPVESEDYMDTAKKVGYNMVVPERKRMRLFKDKETGYYTIDAANRLIYDGYYISNSSEQYPTDAMYGDPFFRPIDNMGFESPENLTLLGGDTDQGAYLTRYQHESEDMNYHFSVHAEGSFVYYRDQNLYFQFIGDDDVYFFINGEIAMDLGGSHGALGDELYLNDIAEEFGMVDGGVYSFDMFYIERHTTASNLKFSTNIKIVETETMTTKGMYLESSNGMSKVDSTTGMGEELADNALLRDGDIVAYSFNIANSRNIPVYNLSFDDTTLGATLSPDTVTLCDTALTGGVSTDISDIKVYYRTLEEDGTFYNGYPTTKSCEEISGLIDTANDLKKGLNTGNYMVSPGTVDNLTALLQLGIPANCQMIIYGFKRQAQASLPSYENTMSSLCYYNLEGTAQTEPDVEEIPIKGTASRTYKVTAEPPKSQKLELVLDYGKAVKIPTTTVGTNIQTDALTTVTGFAGLVTSGNHEQVLSYISSSNLKCASEGQTYAGKQGTFIRTAEGLDYQPTRFMDTIETVYLVFNIEATNSNHKYMLVELKLLPATFVYYETDFAPNIFDTSALSDALFFDFTDDSDAQLRYSAPSYGGKSYDTANWILRTSTMNNLKYDKNSGTLSAKVLNDFTSYILYFQAEKLNYNPNNAKVVTARLRMEGLKLVEGQTPLFYMDFYAPGESAKIADYRIEIEPSYITDGGYHIYEVALPDLASCGKMIDRVRVHVTGVVNADRNNPGTLTLDYLYVGPDQNTVNGYVFEDFNDANSAIAATSTPLNNMTATINRSSGIVSGSISGGDPWLTVTNGSGYNHIIQPNDIVMLRMKVDSTVDLATVKAQGFLCLKEINSGNPKTGYSTDMVEYTNDGTYQIITLTPSKSCYGQTLQGLRIDPINSYSTTTITDTDVPYSIDWIYVGPSELAPPRDHLYFDFKNRDGDQRRYANPNYVGKNYDTGNWILRDGCMSDLTYDNEAGTLSAVRLSSVSITYPYIHYLQAQNLAYYPDEDAQWLIARLKVEDFKKITGSDPTFYVDFYDGKKPDAFAKYYYTIEDKYLDNEEYFVAKLDISTLAETAKNNANSGKVQYLRVHVSNVENASDAVNGKITLDYVYVGREEDLNKIIAAYDQSWKTVEDSTTAADRYQDQEFISTIPAEIDRRLETIGAGPAIMNEYYGIRNGLSNYNNHVPLSFSHRGSFRTSSENSYLAVLESLKQGMDGVEIDLMITSDKVVVLSHDKTLSRTTGDNVTIADVTWNSIRDYPLEVGNGTGDTQDYLLTADEATLLNSTISKYAEHYGEAASSGGKHYTARLDDVLELIKKKAPNAILTFDKVNDDKDVFVYSYKAAYEAGMLKNAFFKLGQSAETLKTWANDAATACGITQAEVLSSMQMLWVIGVPTASTVNSLKSYRNSGINVVALEGSWGTALTAEQESVITNTVIPYCRENNIDFWPTVIGPGWAGQMDDDETTWAYYLEELGVDGLMTDRPEEFGAFMHYYNGASRATSELIQAEHFQSYNIGSAKFYMNEAADLNNNKLVNDMHNGDYLEYRNITFTGSENVLYATAKSLMGNGTLLFYVDSMKEENCFASISFDGSEYCVTRSATMHRTVSAGKHTVYVQAWGNEGIALLSFDSYTFEKQSDDHFLFFDFNNTAEAQNYYKKAIYGSNYNFGIRDYWATYASDNSNDQVNKTNFSIDNEKGIAKVTVGDDFEGENNYCGPKFMTTKTYGVFPYRGQGANAPLKYVPSPNDYLVVRFKLENVIAGSDYAPMLFMEYHWNDDAGTDNIKYEDLKADYSLTLDQWQTVAVPVSDTFKNAAEITSLGLRFTGILSPGATDKGSVIIDYIYVGPIQQGDHLLIDFEEKPGSYEDPVYGGMNYDSEARWTHRVNRTEAPVISDGAISITTTGKAGVLYYHLLMQDAALNYTPGDDDYCEVRFKISDGVIGDATKNTTVNIYFSPDLYGTAGCGGNNNSGAKYDLDAINNGDYYTLQIPMTSVYYRDAGIIRSITLMFNNLAKTMVGTITVDYIYLGPLNQAPSSDSEPLFFDFTDTVADRERYNSYTYGYYNFDQSGEGYWATYATAQGEATNMTNYVMDNITGTATITVGDTAEGENVYGPKFQTTKTYGVYPWNREDAHKQAPLHYKPMGKEYIQARFKIEGCENVGDVKFQLDYHYEPTSGSTYMKYAGLDKPFTYTDGEWLTVTHSLAGITSFQNADEILSVGLRFTGIKSKDAENLGHVVIDYIYIGPEETLPTNNLVTYGYDSSYTDDSRLSNGSSLFVEGAGIPYIAKDSNGNPIYIDYAATDSYTETSFTFTGTGFDIISRTNVNQGLVRAVILDSKGTIVKNVSVINKGKSELYQIPVLSVEGLTHGKYTVKLFVDEEFDYGNDGNADIFGGGMDRGGEFYFDAVRIYNPINTRATDTNSRYAYEVYQKHGEADPTITEVRDILIDANNFTAGSAANGVVYLDATAKEGTEFDNEDGKLEPKIAEYRAIGPNNEVYLTPGNAIAFKMEVEGPIPASIDIGAKSADGAEASMIVGVSKTVPTTLPAGTYRKIQAATAQYYPMEILPSLWNTVTANNTDTHWVYVTIYNHGATGILSVTDIKYAYDFPNPEEPASRKMVRFVVDQQMLDIYANPCNHTWDQGEITTAPTCTAEGVKTFTCTACNSFYTETVPALGHSYINGVCSCGKAEANEPIQETAWKLNHSLNLASDISVNLLIPKTLLEGFNMDTVYVESVIDTYVGNGKTGTTTIRIDPVEREYYYYFTLDGLTAVQMNDKISSVLYATKNGQTYYSPVDEYSIATYAYGQLNKTAIADNLKTLCADLLRYGAKAQLFKGYRTDSLADAAMTEDHKAYPSELEDVAFGNTNRVLNDLNNAPIPWAGKVLNLQSKVALKFVFNTAGYSGNLEDLSLRITYTNIEDKIVTATVKELEIYNAANGQYAFAFDGLLAAELRTVVSAQIYRGETPVSCTLQYSADTYGNNKTGTLLELCKALFAYSDSAKAYFQ